VRPAGRALAAVLTAGVLMAFLRCSDTGPVRPTDEFAAEVKVLKDAESVRTRQGERLAGYLAEYQEDFQPRRVFLSMEILRYEKGERLTIKGDIGLDTARISYGGQPALEVPIVYVHKAGPAGPKTDVEKLIR
jgi:hypothetical protein